jgi:hypothetical protein
MLNDRPTAGIVTGSTFAPVYKFQLSAGATVVNLRNVSEGLGRDISLESVTFAWRSH